MPARTIIAVLGMAAALLFCRSSSAQFLDEFDGPALNGWSYATGDGDAVMDFRQGRGFGQIHVDATRDTRNIWWALIKREVSSALDLNLLSRPGYELRIEARIKVSDAPRRVNLHLNTQKTVDFHSHLMEFDIPDTVGWHTISMTTRGFDAKSGDTVNGQMALIDWGLGAYRVDVDYFKVDVIDAASGGPDKGEPLPYHPPISDPATFRHSVVAAEGAIVDLQYPDVNLSGWYAADDRGKAAVLTVNGSQFTILRWDFQEFAGLPAEGSGLLELTTHSLQRTSSDLEEFGKIRIVEILRGDPSWDQETVTLASLTGGGSIDDVLNGQMVIDVDVTERRGGKTYATISRPVLQRMLDGTTRGLAIRPLGAVSASFYSLNHKGGPMLYFSTGIPPP